MNKMHTSAALAALVVGLSTAAQAQAPASGGAMRPGDSALTCDQLAAEYNTLTEQVAAQQAGAQQKQAQKKAGRGILGGLARGVLVGAANAGYYGAGNSVAGNAAWYGGHAAANATGDAIANAPDAPPAAKASAEQQRLDRVQKLFADKSC